MISKLMQSAAHITWSVPRFFDRLAAENKLSFMTDQALLAKINEDAAEGRINTLYAREYDRRHGRLN